MSSRLGNRFAKAYVNNIKGLLIFPDGWVDSGFGIKEINNATTAYSKTRKKSPATRAGGTTVTYLVSRLSLETFASLQAEGVVFLPASGCRYGSTLNRVGSYWSGTPAGGNNACYMYFGDSYVDASNGDYRSCGRSVRLSSEL